MIIRRLSGNFFAAHSLPMRLHLSLLCLLLSGCYCQPSPNGKRETLQFDSAPQAQPFGAESRVRIPEHIVLQGRNGKLDVSIPYDAKLDFKDTSLETVTTGGLEVVAVTQEENRDYHVTLLCKGNAPEPAELSVKVRSGTSVRYEDAVDFFCHRDVRTFSEHDNETWIAGSAFDVLIRQTPVGMDSMSLTTHYLKLPPNGGFELNYDGGAPDNVYTGLPIPVRAVRATSELRFTSGEMSAALPITVLDDSQWRLGVFLKDTRVPDSAAGGLIVTVEGRPVVDGVDKVHGVANCEVRTTEIDGNGSSRGESGDCTASSWLHDKSVLACMRLREQHGCLVVHPDGGVDPSDAGF